MQGLCAQGWWGHLAYQITQGLHTQGWWGHLANQITQGLCARVAHARVVGTLSQSDYTGVACRGCACRGGGDTQPIRLHRGCV